VTTPAGTREQPPGVVASAPGYLTVGAFRFWFVGQRWEWSDEVARMHGYEPGAVEPTTKLLMAHKHPEDRAHVQDVLDYALQSGESFSSRHRFIDTAGKEHNAIVVADRMLDERGVVVGTAGYYIDLTDTFDETRQEVLDAALPDLFENRAAIEQAKGSTWSNPLWTAESLCSELLQRMTPSSGYRDDVVLLALRPSHAAPRSFATVVPAAAAQIPVARGRLRGWLNTAAVVPRRELDILLVTGEAVTNAIEHGSNGEPHRTVSVEAFLRRDTVAITVSDTGQWVGDSSASLRHRRRGRGLTLMGGLADRVHTVRTPGGTRVTLEFDGALTG